MHNGERIGVTISIGATLGKMDDSSGSLIKRADRLMYQSKQEGRNRVTCDVA
jgi:PleD family two-component response regulator